MERGPGPRWGTEEGRCLGGFIQRSFSSLFTFAMFPEMLQLVPHLGPPLQCLDVVLGRHFALCWRDQALDILTSVHLLVQCLGYDSRSQSRTTLPLLLMSVLLSLPPQPLEHWHYIVIDSVFSKSFYFLKHHLSLQLGLVLNYPKSVS